MQVDTDVFAALTERAELAEQVAALGRKVTHLSGRVTLLDAHVAGRVTDLTRLISVVFCAGDRRAPKHAAPKRDRHLRVVR